MFRPFTALATLGMLVAASQLALAQSSPTTVTPDRSQVLVNKDIAGQRWAIARNVNNGAVTGNVFIPGSTDPQFVYCEQTGESSLDYNYNCSGMGRCTVSDCATAWTFVSRVTLPKSFFAAGGPAPTPVPSSGLSGLIGTWRFNYVLITNFSDTYRLRTLTTTNSGIPALLGVDVLNDPVRVLRIQDVTPGSTLPYEFYLLDPGVIICQHFFFNRAGNTVDGVYAQTDVIGNECGTDIGNVYPMSGTRLSSGTAATSSTEQSPAVALERDLTLQGEDAAAVSRPSADLSAAIGEFLQQREPVR